MYPPIFGSEASFGKNATAEQAVATAEQKKKEKEKGGKKRGREKGGKKERKTIKKTREKII